MNHKHARSKKHSKGFSKAHRCIKVCIISIKLRRLASPSTLFNAFVFSAFSYLLRVSHTRRKRLGGCYLLYHFPILLETYPTPMKSGAFGRTYKKYFLFATNLHGDQRTLGGHCGDNRYVQRASISETMTICISVPILIVGTLVLPG